MEHKEEVVQSFLDRLKTKSPEEQALMIKIHPDYIRYIDNPPEYLQLAAIEEASRYYGFILRHLKNPTYNVLKKVAENSPQDLRDLSLHIDNPSLIIKLIKNFPISIIYLPVEFITKNEIRLAINTDPKIYDFIIERSDFEEITDDPDTLYNELTLFAAKKGNPGAVVELTRIGKQEEIDKLPEDIKIKTIQSSPYSYAYFSELTPKMQMEVIKAYPGLISTLLDKYGSSIETEVIKKAITKNPETLLNLYGWSQDKDHIKNQKALEKINSVKNELIELAVKNDPSIAIKIDVHQSLPENIWDLALSLNPEIFSFFKYFEKDQLPKNITEKLAYKYFPKNPYAFLFIKNPSERLQEEALTSDPSIIKHIENPSHEIQKIAIDTDVQSIMWMDNPAEDIQLTAINKNPHLIQFIKNPSEKVVWTAIDKDFSVISHTKLPFHFYEEIIEKYPDSLFSIYDRKYYPSEELLLKIVPKLSEPWKLNEYIYSQLSSARMDFKELYSQEFIEKINELIERYTKKLRQFRPKLIKRRYIPKDLNADQLSLLRWFDLNNRELITVKELKQQSFGNTPYFQDLIKIKKGKDITRNDIIPLSGIKKDLMSFFKERGKLGYIKWKGMQRIFNKINHAMVFYLIENDAEELGNSESLEYNQIVPDDPGIHPKVSRNATIGWIRYTLFDKDIWIDEIQSDLFKSLPKHKQEEIKNLPEYILARFIREMRKRGYQKFYMPTYETKHDLYSANPPVSLYKDLPRKMRFKSTKFNKEELMKNIRHDTEHLVKKPEYTGWVLARNETSEEDLIKQDPNNIQYIDRPSKDLMKLAVSIDPFSIHHMKFPPEEVQLMAINEAPFLIRHMSNISPKALILAVEKDPFLISSLPIQSEAAKWVVLKKDPSLINEINYPDERMQLYAVQKNPDLIKRIKNPTEKVKEQAISLKQKSSKFRPGFHEKKFLPKDLSADQLFLLRLMETNNQDKISVKQIKNTLGMTPYTQALIQHYKGRDLTKKDILAFSDKQIVNQLFSYIKENYKLGIEKWYGMQIIFFKKPNYVMVMYLDNSKIPSEFKDNMIDPDPTGSHPKIGNNMTVGWVRYTLFNKDVWIDEVQSELFKTVEDTSIKKLPEFILLTFIREMRKRGFQKFYMPTYEMKSRIYKADSPISIYRDLPKKLRFKKKEIEGVDKKVDGWQSWVLAKTIQS